MSRRTTLNLHDDAWDALENIQRILNKWTGLKWSLSKAASYAIMIAEPLVQRHEEVKEEEK